MALVVGAACALLPGAARGQEPPDTLPPEPVAQDSVPAVADSMGVDSLGVQESQAVVDSAAVPDSLQQDTIFYNLPELEGEIPAGWARGTWEWDTDDIMASGANTLVELMADVPGVVPLRGGDYGTPLGLTAFGAAGGALRVIRDGFDVLPLEGSVPDLSRIGLGGIEHVRLERHAGELVIRMRSRTFDDGRPFSLVEAGTGDLDTNVFRGTFAEPTALGGSVALSLERADTRGTFAEEPGNRNGVWLRYALHRGDDAGIALDFRRMGSETEVSDYAEKATRTDWGVRGRARLAPGLVGEAYWGRSHHKVEDGRDAYETEGGERSQLGARLAFQSGPVFARGAYRRFGADELPEQRMDFALGAHDARYGGVEGQLGRASWAGTTTSAKRVRAWAGPLLGLSVFGSWESGTFGVRGGPLAQIEPPVDTTAAEPADTAQPELPSDPLFEVVDRSATRLGAQFAWRGILLSGARLEAETDSLFPLGLETDRGEPALAGGRREGWEAFARLPLSFWDGFHLEGSLQQWDGDWPYLPERVYRGAFVYHNVLKESGTLELWWRLGVRGRDPMSVRRVVGELTDEETGETMPELGAVPFYQSWYGTIQVRVVSVRIFIGWENFTVRRNLQDFPDRILPRTRAFYGLRWTMWN